MKTCSYCGAENEEQAAACVKCGTEFDAEVSSDATDPVTTEFAETDQLTVLFRGLVLSSTVLYTGWFVMSWAGVFVDIGGLYSLSVLNWHGYGALLPLPQSVHWLVLLLYVAVAVGLWFFAASARMLFLMLTVFSVFLALLSGLSVSTPVDVFVGWATSLADGAILALAYASPIKHRFK